MINKHNAYSTENESAKQMSIYCTKYFQTKTKDKNKTKQDIYVIIFYMKMLQNYTTLIVNIILLQRVCIIKFYQYFILTALKFFC